MQINITMEVPNPPDNMSKEEWAVRCIEDPDFFEKALIQRKPLRKYWIQDIQVWMTRKEERRFNKRKDQSPKAWGDYIWEMRSRIYREGFIESGLMPLKRYSFKFKDGEVKIERDN